jgi:hypothetical protein
MKKSVCRERKRASEMEMERGEREGGRGEGERMDRSSEAERDLVYAAFL